MKKNEVKKINNNWKEFTGYNNSIDFWKENNKDSKLLQETITKFMQKYDYYHCGYSYEVWNYLTYGWY